MSKFLPVFTESFLSMHILKNNQNNQSLNLTEIMKLLEHDGLISLEVKNKILEECAQDNRHPLEIVAEYQLPDRRNSLKKLTIDELCLWIAKKYHLDFIKVDPLKIKIESIVSLVPYAYAHRLQILPIFVDEKNIHILTAQPANHDWITELKLITKKNIILKMGSPVQIRFLLQEFYVVQKAISKINRHHTAEEKKLISSGRFEELDALIERGRQKKWGTNDSSIVRIVDWLINFADNERASDIHLEPKKGLSHIRFRVDGKLQVVYKMDYDAMLAVISRIKILGEMKIDEKRKPQDGRVKRFLDNGKKVEMRLSVIPTYYGEKLVIRIFDQPTNNKDLGFIGFSPEDAKIWDQMIHSSQGLILVTGPTGSGKTTTLYSTLNLVATDEVNVCTIEDPIEMTIDSLNQVQVNESVGMTFPLAIKSFLRQDPDIILVGEIRDQETADVAIQASLTGHLVFSTVHTNGALATIQRLIDLGLPTFLINSSLKGILAQRLVRKLCSHCKEKIATPLDQWKSLVDQENITPPEFIFQAKGCKECKATGYSGRICIYELVKYQDQIKKIIHPKIEMTELKEKTRGLFINFRMNCASKVKLGITSLQEVLEIVY